MGQRTPDRTTPGPTGGIPSIERGAALYGLADEAYLPENDIAFKSAGIFSACKVAVHKDAAFIDERRRRETPRTYVSVEQYRSLYAASRSRDLRRRQVKP